MMDSGPKRRWYRDREAIPLKQIARGLLDVSGWCHNLPNRLERSLFLPSMSEENYRRLSTSLPGKANLLPLFNLPNRRPLSGICRRMEIEFTHHLRKDDYPLAFLKLLSSIVGYIPVDISGTPGLPSASVVRSTGKRSIPSGTNTSRVRESQRSACAQFAVSCEN